MCIKYLVLPNFRVFQVIHEPFLNTISNISSYFRGIQKSTFCVTKGGPFFSSFDPLSKVFKYGNRCFAQYPAGMPDYFKQVFPAGMSFERTVTYEDGGVATASGHFRYKSDDQYRIDIILIERNLQGHFSHGEGKPFLKCNLVVILPRTLTVQLQGSKPTQKAQ